MRGTEVRPGATLHFQRLLLTLTITQGSWWLSYRPIIKCELVTPSSSGLIAYPPPQTEAIELDDQGHEHTGPPPGLAPAYTE
jgi:hypothetical protein